MSNSSQTNKGLFIYWSPSVSTPIRLSERHSTVSFPLPFGFSKDFLVSRVVGDATLSLFPTPPVFLFHIFPSKQFLFLLKWCPFLQADPSWILPCTGSSHWSLTPQLRVFSHFWTSLCIWSNHGWFYWSLQSEDLLLFLHPALRSAAPLVHWTGCFWILLCKRRFHLQPTPQSHPCSPLWNLQCNTPRTHWHFPISMPDPLMLDLSFRIPFGFGNEDIQMRELPLFLFGLSSLLEKVLFSCWAF